MIKSNLDSTASFRCKKHKIRQVNVHIVLLLGKHYILYWSTRPIEGVRLKIRFVAGDGGNGVGWY